MNESSIVIMYLKLALKATVSVVAIHYSRKFFHEISTITLLESHYQEMHKIHKYIAKIIYE